MSHQDSAPLLCGTSAGYMRHLRARETPCEDCKAAHSLYMKLWRARPGNMQRVTDANEARRRAQARLARMHPTQYRLLYQEERQKQREQGH